MPSSTSPQSDNDAAPQPTRRLKLTMPSAGRQHGEIETSAGHNSDLSVKESSGSPPRPSYSPVTPTLPHPALAVDPADSQTLPPWIDEPEAPPVSLDENPDAMALRAAISILQLQRQQSLRDIKELDRIKRVALAEPEAFIKELKAGNLSKPPPTGIDMDVDDSSGDEEMHDNQPGSKFGLLPTAQNIIRCPPIEWEKYHVVGEPLDRLHEEQKRYPGTTDNQHGRINQAPEHLVAAPYRPFVDKLEEPFTPAKRSNN